MDRKCLPAVPRLQKSPRRHRRIQRKIYGKPKSAAGRLRGYFQKTHTPHLSQFFPNQLALAVHRNKVGQLKSNPAMAKTNNKLDSTFKKEIFEGLSAFPKYLSSKYFYDKKGDELFQAIMAMPGYYLTD